MCSYKLLIVQLQGTNYKGIMCSYKGTNSERAVHLKLVHSISEHDFLDAFMRFSSRRSCPQIIYSDNAATFVSKSKSLNELARTAKVQNTLCKYRVDWHFVKSHGRVEFGNGR